MKSLRGERAWFLWLSLALQIHAAGGQITVAPGVWGDYHSIQAALDAVPNPNAETVVIYVYPGIYEERVNIPKGKDHIILKGVAEDRSMVVLREGAGDPVFRAAADDLIVEDLTIENTAGATAGQQQAVYVNGKRQIFENVLIEGWQDTLAIWDGALCYFHGCDVWGSVDFIYSGGTAVFDHCDITQRRDTGGPIAAPSTPASVPYGFVFLQCNITRTDNVADNSTTLMRPWRDYGATAYIHCTVDRHITAKGWSEWDGCEATCRAAEYGSVDPYGRPIPLSQRAAWVRLLTESEAAAYTLPNILGGWDPTERPEVEEAPTLRRSNLDVLLQERPGGAAGLNGGTSGGAAGRVVTATTLEELKDYAGSSEPLTILIEKPLISDKQGSIALKSHKTIIGMTPDAALIGCGLSMNGAEDIVIRYLTLKDNTLIGDYDGKANDFDALALRDTHHVWIDHCHLSRAGDGLLDMTYGSGHITISWTVLSFHNKVAAVTGRSSEASPLTFDHCWFNNTVQRNAAVTACEAHATNCLFTGIRSYGMNAREGTLMLLENCVFRQCHNPYYAENGGQLRAVNCLLEQADGRAEQTSMSWRPSYDYVLDPVNDVSLIVTAGAGPNGHACPDTGPTLGINFLPEGQSTVYGCYSDEGSAFELNTGGLSYGWSRAQTGDAFWRRTISTKDEQSLVPVDVDMRRNGGIGFADGACIWEIVVADGWYDVRVVCGDPGDPRDSDNPHTNPTRLNHIMIEGVRVEDPDGILPCDYDESVTRVKVTDGRLTLAQAQDGINASVCFLEITPASAFNVDPFITPAASRRPPRR
jgi:pectinesterase